MGKKMTREEWEDQVDDGLMRLALFVRDHRREVVVAASVVGVFVGAVAAALLVKRLRHGRPLTAEQVRGAGSEVGDLDEDVIVSADELHVTP